MQIQDTLILSVFLCVACGAGTDEGDDNLPSCEEDVRDEAYVAGINKSGAAGYTLRLMDSNPAPPSKGDNIWSLDLTDPAGATAAGLGLSLRAFMPDHGHGSPVKPEVTDNGDGTYTIDPVNLFMPGYWEVSLTVVDLGATESPDDDIDLDSVMFKFCVEG